MSEAKRQRQQQILRESEGYLDLAQAMGRRCSLPASVRQPLTQQALRTLDRLDAAAQQRPQVLFLRARVLEVAERYDEAIEHLNQAARRDEENIHIYLALGWCHKRNGRLDLAIQALEEALIIDAEEPLLYYNLACYWALARSVPLTLRYLARAFDLDEQYRERVAEEPDFDPIRQDPAFQALISVIV